MSGVGKRKNDAERLQVGPTSQLAALIGDRAKQVGLTLHIPFAAHRKHLAAGAVTILVRGWPVRDTASGWDRSSTLRTTRPRCVTGSPLKSGPASVGR